MQANSESLKLCVIFLFLPAGQLVSIVLLSWLYSYYCFDYKWALQGIKLQDRLAYVERRWAFFAGE